MVAMNGEYDSVEPVSESAPPAPVSSQQERPAPQAEMAESAPTSTVSYPEQSTGRVVDHIV